MKQLTFADGIIRIGGEELPGILVSFKVDGKIRYDEQKVDGTSGKKKTPQGWEDHVLVSTVALLTDSESDCYDKLEILSNYFKEPDAKANPKIYAFTNRHAQARGVRLVIFDRLESSENDQTDVIMATMGFKEHEPPIIRTEGAVAKTPTPKEMAEKAAEQAAGKEPEASKDVLEGTLE